MATGCSNGEPSCLLLVMGDRALVHGDSARRDLERTRRHLEAPRNAGAGVATSPSTRGSDPNVSAI
jgi:hypothetical protein